MSLDLSTSSGQPSADGRRPLLLLRDRFEQPIRPGSVIGSRAPDGGLRCGIDREATMSVDHGQLRIGWMEHGGWGRSAIVHGPFADPVGLTVVVRALNGLTTSQTDWRPEGRRAMVRRWRDTFPAVAVRRAELRESFLAGWFTETVPNRRPDPVAAVAHRAGQEATGELWFLAGEREVRICPDLQNLPATYAVTLRGDEAVLQAWSHPGARGYAEPGSAEVLARLPVDDPLPDGVWAGVHQSILGEVRYRVDSRIEAVEVWRDRSLQELAGDDLARRWWAPRRGPVAIEDHFEGDAGDLDGRRTPDGAVRWSRVMGSGAIDLDGAGAAQVRATRTAPNPGRTVYCLPWRSDGHEGGVEVSATVVPPGRARGEGHQGRSGVVFWQDPDNHLVLNHFIDDGSVGVSISAFLRTGGHEEMFDWDAVWSNVGRRVRWGQPFRLTVACDGRRFLCHVDGEPVLGRSLSDYRADAAPLAITGVGLVANWEWGDDTGTAFDDVTVRPLLTEPGAVRPPGGAP